MRPVDAKKPLLLSSQFPPISESCIALLVQLVIIEVSIVSPLTDLLSPAKDLIWDAKCDPAFQTTKAILSSSPVLLAPDFAVPFKLEGDARGAVLLQEDSSGIDQTVCYFSKKFSVAQLKYSTIEEEALAMLWALQGLCWLNTITGVCLY